MGGSSSSAKRYLRGVVGCGAGDLASKNCSSPSPGSAIGGTGGFDSAGAGGVGVGSVIPRSWKTSSMTSARAGVAASAAIPCCGALSVVALRRSTGLGGDC